MSLKWLSGLRRSHLTSGALARYISDHEVSGVVWYPEAYVVDDVSEPLVSLASSGATLDDALLWDLAVQDIRLAARMLDPMEGIVAVWMNPATLADPGKATASAKAIIESLDVDGIAVAFAFTGARAGTVSTIVGAGIPVAVTIAPNMHPTLLAARTKGIERLRRDLKDEFDPDQDSIAVFSLGTDGAPQGLHAVDLVTDSTWFARIPRGASIPRSQQAEFDGVDAAAKSLAKRSEFPARWVGFSPDLQRDVVSRCKSLEIDGVAERLWAGDGDLWPGKSLLGWLDLPSEAVKRAQGFETIRSRSGPYSRVVLIGTGGSALGALKLARGSSIEIVDASSTHPDDIAEIQVDDSTLFVVSSKSGTTAETRAIADYFWSRFSNPHRWIAITDAGSDLEKLANERKFAAVEHGEDDIGGRFSTLGVYGMLPAALAQADIRTVALDAEQAATSWGPTVIEYRNDPFLLGAALAEGFLQGRDKLTFVGRNEPWLEQLIAESLGKDGKGIVPVMNESLRPTESYSDDRLLVVAPGVDVGDATHIVVSPMPIGREVVLWQIAVAVAGHIMELDPFDQPAVEAAKTHAKALLGGAASAPVDTLDLEGLLASLDPMDWIAVNAFVARSSFDRVEQLSRALSLKLEGRVVVCNLGPQYLHSTGQLQKDGPNNCAVIQVFETLRVDIPMVGSEVTFGSLVKAQADGDLIALNELGRRCSQVTLDQFAAAAR